MRARRETRNHRLAPPSTSQFLRSLERRKSNTNVRMIGRIAELRERYEAERFRPAHLTLRELNARTTLNMADDILIWNMIFSERELTPGA